MMSAPRGRLRPFRPAFFLSAAYAPFILWAVPACAQDVPDKGAKENSDIVVTGRRLRGSVDGPIKPETTVDASAIAATGASTLADLIAQLSAQTGGTQSRANDTTIVLLNGRRISSLREVRNLPPEAVSRVEILPEEAAIRFGYSAHQKVINVVLLPSFAAATGELEDSLSGPAARNYFNTEGDFVRIAGDNRITLDLQYQIGNDLTEARRGIVSGDGSLRTIIPLTHEFTANGVFARALGDGIGFTANLNIDRLTSRAWIGPMESDPQRPLVRTTQTDTGHLGGVLNGSLGRWSWSVTSNADRVATYIDTAQDGSVAARNSRGIDDTLAADVVANGSLFAIPSGDVGLSVQASASGEKLTARDETGISRPLTRRLFDGQLALDVPILRSASPIGAVAAGANAAWRDYSDLSAPVDRGWTVTWTPRSSFTLLIADNREAAPPTITQLGSPLVTTPGATFFDFGAAQNVVATRLDGGDARLRHDMRSLYKVEATLKPAKSISLIATYTGATTRNEIVLFPGISPTLEAAFPDRIQRNDHGTITLVDTRPVNLFSENRKDVRVGINFSKSWSAATGPKLPGGGSFGGNHYFGAGGSSLQFALYDTVRLSDTIVLVSGSAPIDLMRDNILGEGLRAPRHMIDAQLSGTYRGFGLRANATWHSREDVAPLLPASLRFAEPLIVNLRLFYFPARSERAQHNMPWLKGVRFLIAVDNLLSSATDVRDRSGAVPTAYQRGYLDPVGRSIRFSIRKTIQ